MTILLFLLAVSLAVAACGLLTFLWSLRTGQYDDLDGAANRILFDDDAAMSGPTRVTTPAKSESGSTAKVSLGSASDRTQRNQAAL